MLRQRRRRKKRAQTSQEKAHPRQRKRIRDQFRKLPSPCTAVQRMFYAVCLISNFAIYSTILESSNVQNTSYRRLPLQSYHKNHCAPVLECGLPENPKAWITFGSSPSLKISSEWNLWKQGMEEQSAQTLIKAAKMTSYYGTADTQDVEPDFSVRSDPP